MSRKMYLLVFPGRGDVMFHDAAFEAFLGRVMEVGDAAYTIDGNVAVLSTMLDIDNLVTRLKKTSAGADQFFITDISKSDRAGNMVPRFWSFIRQEEAAEVA